jgi:serine/threonine protein kinase
MTLPLYLSPSKSAQGCPPSPATIGGRYRLEQELGRGAHARVYRARDLSTDQLVALKVLAAADLSDVAMNRFLREARLFAKLDHPGIVRVWNSGQDPGGHAFLVMEFLEGQTLDAWMTGKALEQRTREDFRFAARVLFEVAAALAAAHAAGIIHRDVKPSNIFLCQEPRGELIARLLDFGIAKDERLDITKMTRTGDLVGTAEYVSPEQIDGRADFRSDIYSLGVVLFEVLCGTTPFRADSPLGVLDKMNAAGNAVPDPRGLNPRAPVALAKICLKATAVAPDARFASAAEMADALRGWLDTARENLVTAESRGQGKLGRLSSVKSWLCLGVCAVALAMILGVQYGHRTAVHVQTAQTAAIALPLTEISLPATSWHALAGQVLPWNANPSPAIRANLAKSPLASSKQESSVLEPSTREENIGTRTIGQPEVKDALARRDYEAVEALCREALAQEGGRAWPHHSLAAAYLAQGRYAAAREALGKAVEIEPQKAEYRLALGKVLARLGQGEEAARQWRKAIDLDPRNSQARALLEAHDSSAAPR